MQKQELRKSPKRFDATLKDLVENYPADWVAQLGLPFKAPIDVIDADLSTISTQADKILRVQEATPWLLHIEMQASEDEGLARRTLKYHALLHERHRVPVHSAIMLLRPEADHKSLTGTLQTPFPFGGHSIEFQYQVMRVWQQPVEAVLNGGVGSLPLAPLCNVEQDAVPGILQQMQTRLSQEVKPAEGRKILTASYILSGLRFSREASNALFQGVFAMRESTTYQAILDEGRAEGRAKGRAEGRVIEARTTILRLGTIRFGIPGLRVKRALNRIEDIRQLEKMTEKLLRVSSWDELLNNES